jgi:transcriptional regulator with XRE-family HTH domain
MRIETLNSDETILAEIGRRLARTRLERNISQEELATEAGVSKSTVERLEAGHAVKLPSFLRVLRALGQLEVLDRLVPEPLPSPVERLKLQGRRRRRARIPQSAGKTEPWRWGDEQAPDESG